MNATPLFDPGLQPERTALAWRRTALSVAVGSLVAMRLLPETFDHPAWSLPGILGVMFAVWLWWVSHKRYQGATMRLARAPGRGLHGSAELYVASACSVVIGLAALIVIVAAGTP